MPVERRRCKEKCAQRRLKSKRAAEIGERRLERHGLKGRRIETQGKVEGLGFLGDCLDEDAANSNCIRCVQHALGGIGDQRAAETTPQPDGAYWGETGPDHPGDYATLISNQLRDGTLLGLAIVRHIVELHGESVALRSTPGVGTIVAFGLPIAATAAQVLPMRPPVGN